MPGTRRTSPCSVLMPVSVKIIPLTEKKLSRIIIYKDSSVIKECEFFYGIL